MKILVSLLMLFYCVGWPSIAESEVIELKVKGLVCDFCARTIERSLEKTGKVEFVNVDLNKGEIFIQTKPDEYMSDEEIDRAILDSGYDLVSIMRE